MVSPLSPVAGDVTPTQPKSKPRAAKARPNAQRRVYGKRRVDAPRAVFDQRSPAKTEVKKLPTPAQESVESLQEKLAEVRIGDGQDNTQKVVEPVRTTEKVEEQVEETPDSTGDVDEIPATEQIDTPKLETSVEPENETAESTPSKPETAPKKQYEAMVEVRVSPKTAARRTKQEQEQKESHGTGETGRRTRRTKPAPSKPAQRQSAGFVSDQKANTYVRTILDEALSPVAAQSVQKFGSWAARAGNMLEVVKIAEGSYGEVYKLRLREEVCKKEMSKSKLARLKAYGDGVFKVVPLRAQSGPGSKKFTSIEEIVSEAKMLKYLDPIPGFARFREIHVVQGRFPESFQKAWDHYKKTKDDCLNPNPSSKRAYPDSQLWAIIEMDDAGCELEKFAWSSIFQIYDIFWGVAMALARAEEYAQFEHRDLHLGNVCIRSTRPDGRMDPPTELEILRLPSASGFGISTLETTIIDYSLSRAELRTAEESGETLDIASSDLDKKQIFDAVGRDEDEILLRNTYRYMRAQLYTGQPLDDTKPADIPGIWSEYAPRTNLVWLLFLLKSLLKNHKTEAPPQRQPLAPRSPNKEVKPKSKSQKKADNLLSTQAITQVQSNVSQWQKTLQDRLNSVLGLLDLDHGHEDMCCAADLVAYAIDSQWLGEEDFF
ncbi:hypothetical protein P170DRAFT_374222 [Aspergillus steynii IBT 23096]|uniref:non-specific serine/threonine protein kinase n=1 Tax=Aspergillus steynii IBT 23096 TaxID=1392250 RepID=A0A2I2GPN5_9EURO|nr:uncharacterized protein P170DRAFT_374222 [Aspergillus steynii IBT 23096]PLB54823.1 hypothetical protein P170DRAFT_374222 [Aspergillus steynii IBT 23096]